MLPPWPDVVDLRLLGPFELAVPLGVLGEQCGSVRRVQSFVTQPARNKEAVLHDRLQLDVLVPTTGPLEEHAVVVDLERADVLGPHEDSRVSSPTMCLSEKSADDLHGFDSLLAEALTVQDLRALVERWIG